MDLRSITQKNTKQEIWKAYQETLKELEGKAEEPGEEKGKAQQPQLDLEEKKILSKVADLQVEKVVSGIGELKSNFAGTLEKFGDRLVEEIKKLDTVKSAIAIAKEELEKIYQIKTEANMLLDLIELREKKKVECQREQEEYAYNLKIVRKKEEDEYAIKTQAKEREWNEKMAAKEKELKARETIVAEQEKEIKDLRTKMETIPSELEKVKEETAKHIREEMTRQAKVESELAMKDLIKEREISKLRISTLEEAVKKQTAQIQTLETQLDAANQKAQELAVKVIEGGRDRENKRVIEEGVNNKTEK